jgi:hypothetical protein
MTSSTVQTGFLVTDGSDMGRAIELLRQYALQERAPYIRDLAERLNNIPVASYHQRIDMAEVVNG